MKRRMLLVGVIALMGAIAFVAFGCGDGETIIEKEVPVVQTVLVEKPGETMIVEKEVVRTVVVEKEGKTQIVEIVRTVIVTETGETKIVEVEVPVVQTVVVEKIIEVQITAIPASEPMGGPTGDLKVGVSVLPPPVQLPSKDAAGTIGSFAMDWSVYEPILKAQLPPVPGSPSSPSPDDYLPALAEAWAVSDDLRKVTFNIRKGVPWHDPTLGEVTADDVAWTFNESFVEGSTGNGAEALQPALKAGWDVIDQYVAVMNIGPEGFPPTWGVLMGKGWGDTYGIVSKRLYDRIGETKFITTPVGTGPFKINKWIGHDEVKAEAVEDHWNVTARIATMNIFEMPEQATREAALRTGEVDIAPIPGKALRAIVDDLGGGAVVMGLTNPNTIYMSGNYWGATCPSCPETDVYRKWSGFTEGIANGYPWIGDPDDPVQMEKARKVRLAMSMAIDRQTIIDTVLGGFGDPVYIHMHHQFPPGTQYYKDEWTIDYDPVAAKALLTEAGYPDGFEVTFWSAPDYSFWDYESADAAGEMWRQNLGLDVTVDHSPYASRRPESVDKSMNVPWLHGWGTFPGDTKAQFFCPGPGHIGGVTLPDDICEIGFRNDAEPDFVQRVLNNQAMQSYLSDWALHIGIATVGNYFVYQPYIKGWRPFTVNYFNNPETISIER